MKNNNEFRVESMSDYLGEEYEEQMDQETPWEIDNDEKANWALRKCAEIEEEKERISDLAAAETLKIATWKEKQIEQLQKSREYFEGMLGYYLMRLREKNDKAKINVPNGTVYTRKSPQKWSYDEEKVIAWAKEAGKSDWIMIREELNKADLKKQVKALESEVVLESTGEVIEGITLTDGEEKVVVRLK
ncbi:MAG: host-nuclease inhibitor Gam family protein [Tissierellia bacterium]|nr:host-nuclease inhibitor Gam family protein [Tissierellia bacterium]